MTQGSIITADALWDGKPPEADLSPDDRTAVAQSRRIRSVVCLAAALAVMATLYLRASELLRDPDNWWQVKVGLDMLANRAWPVIDTYSHTFAGKPWIAKEWLGQVLLASGYAAFGWNGVAFVTITSIMLMIACLTWYLSASLKPIVALAAVFMITIVAGAVYNARPLIFSLPIIVVWTAVLFDAARKAKAPPFWLLGLIFLWANLHGTFTFGFVIAAFAGLDCLSRVRLSQPRLLANWVLFGLLCPVVTLVNPYGLKAILATFTVASGNEAVPYIQEWSPFNAQTDHYAYGALLLATAALLMARPRIRWTYAAFFLFTLHLFLSYVRFQYLWLLLVPIVLAADLAGQFPALSLKNWITEPRDRLERAIITHFRAICCAMALFWLAATTIFLQTATAAPAAANAASGAIAYARAHHLSGNVMNAYNFGGSLIFHDIKTYIDGRTDQLFLGGFMDDTVAMGTTAGKPLLLRDLETYAVTWAILPPGDGRIPYFDALPDWRKAYEDDVSVVYVKDH